MAFFHVNTNERRRAQRRIKDNHLNFQCIHVVVLSYDTHGEGRDNEGRKSLGRVPDEVTGLTGGVRLDGGLRLAETFT